MMWVYILVPYLLFVLGFVLFFMGANANKSEWEKRMDDEEQMKWLRRQRMDEATSTEMEGNDG